MTINDIAPWVNGGIFITLIGLIFNRKKVAAEAAKIFGEAQQITNNIEIQLVEFYQKQVTDLTVKYEELERKFEDKEQEHTNCQQSIIELEKKYNTLLIKVNLLTNNNN